MKVLIVDRDCVYVAIAPLVKELIARPESSSLVILTGDRVRCCDEAVVAYDEAGSPVGIATIAPNGEENSNVPTIVAVYVRPNARSQGLGSKLLERAVARLEERGLPQPYQVDIISKAGKGLVNNLADTTLAKLRVVDYTRWSFT